MKVRDTSAPPENVSAGRFLLAQGVDSIGTVYGN
jgi:hypothetical protein